MQSQPVAFHVFACSFHCCQVMEALMLGYVQNSHILMVSHSKQTFNSLIAPLQRSHSFFGYDKNHPITPYLSISS